MTKAKSTDKADNKAPIKATRIVEGADAIIKLGTGIQTRSRKVDADTQVWAVSAVAHVNTHGDIRPITAMFDGKLGTGLRQNALREFIETFAKVTYSEKGKCFVYDKTADGDTEAAQVNLWTDFKPEPPYQAMNELAMLQQLLKRMNKADAAKGDVVSPATVNAVAGLIAALDGSEVQNGVEGATADAQEASDVPETLEA